MELTPEEKAKVKKVLKGIAIFVCAYAGAQCGVKAALKNLKIDLNLVSDGIKVPVIKLK